MVKAKAIIETHTLLPRGQYSLEVILPMWWLRMNKLKAGSSVRVEASPARVIVTPVKDVVSRRPRDEKH
jgi:hypothetical protein